MAESCDLPDVSAHAHTLPAADTLIEINLDFIFDGFKSRFFNRGKTGPLQPDFHDQLQKAAELVLAACGTVPLVLLQDGRNAFPASLDDFRRMSLHNHAVLGFRGARCLEFAVRLNKTGLAVARNAQAGIVTECGNVNAISECGLKNCFIRKDFSNGSVQGNGPALNILKMSNSK